MSWCPEFDFRGAHTPSAAARSSSDHVLVGSPLPGLLTVTVAAEASTSMSAPPLSRHRPPTHAKSRSRAASSSAFAASSAASTAAASAADSAVAAASRSCVRGGDQLVPRHSARSNRGLCVGLTSSSSVADCAPPPPTLPGA